MKEMLLRFENGFFNAIKIKIASFHNKKIQYKNIIPFNIANPYIFKKNTAQYENKEIQPYFFICPARTSWGAVPVSVPVPPILAE